MDIGSGGANWVVQQTVDYDHFATGQLYRQTTRNASSTVIEEHVLSYDDTNGKYVGHRTRDEFTLQSPTNTVCASACTASYTYDPRGRLVATQDGHGGSTSYTLDPQGNVTRESVTLGGTTVTRTFFYSHDVHEALPPSNQLVRIEDGATPGNVLAKYYYDARGNLSCVTTDAWNPPTPSDPGTRCPAVGGSGAVDNRLLEHYVHDDFDRLVRVEGYVSSTLLRRAEYAYDPLDRPVRQTERHTISGTLAAEKTRAYTYQGLTNAVAKETHHSGADTSGSLLRTKTYALDAFGRPTTIENDSASPTTDDPDGRFTYGRDVHGSVSQLIDSTGAMGAVSCRVTAAADRPAACARDRAPVGVSDQ